MNKQTDSSLAPNSQSSSHGQYDSAYASLHVRPGTPKAEISQANTDAGTGNKSSGYSIASGSQQSEGHAPQNAANISTNASFGSASTNNTQQLPVCQQLTDLTRENDDADFTTEPQVVDWTNATYNENGVLVEQYPPPILPAPAPGFSRAGVRWALKSRCHRVYQAKEGRREKWSCLRLYCTSCPRLPMDEDFVDEYGP